MMYSECDNIITKQDVQAFREAKGISEIFYEQTMNISHQSCTLMRTVVIRMRRTW